MWCVLLFSLLAPPEFETATPESQGMSSAELAKFTRWVRDNPAYPVFSVLIARNGKLVYELYTSKITRDDAHYLMSVTKSILSALIGIAIDQKLLRDAPMSELLPRRIFAGDAEQRRFSSLTLKQVMGMQGLDAPDPPRVKDAESLARYHAFWTAPNRVTVAVQRPILKNGFQYNDSTPTLASAALQYAVKTTALEFAEKTLFRALGFRNYEWLHQDAAGFDNGGYGLRLRPIDMLKFGQLFADGGLWRGQRVVGKDWVERSFDAWNRSTATAAKPDYGWFWWAAEYGPGWTAHIANGWKGQRIAVFPEQKLVVVMTAAIEDGSEGEFFNQLVAKIVKPSVEHGAVATDAVELAPLLSETQRGPLRFGDFIEHRMVPSAKCKAERRKLAGPDAQF